MLTRGEIEGQLRQLHPMRERARQRRLASLAVRRYMRLALAVLLGLVMVAALGSTGRRSSPAAQGAMHQLATWGVERVRGFHVDDAPLFPMVRRDRGNAYASRARAARETVRDAQHSGR